MKVSGRITDFPTSQRGEPTNKAKPGTFMVQIILMRDRAMPKKMQGMWIGFGKNVIRAATLAAFISVVLLAGQRSQPPQRQIPTTNLSYEVASIKPNESGSANDSADIGPYLRATNITLRSLILISYQLFEFQLNGGPDWIGSSRFDIEAKAADTAQTYGPEQIRAMVRSLLEDRFQLKVHRETRDMPVFDLVVAKSGSKLKPTLDTGTRAGSGSVRRGPTGVEITGTANTIEEIIRRLGTQAERAIIDKTNLTGRFDFTLKFSPHAVVPIRPEPPNESIGPDIFIAIEDQLGLKLVSGRGPVEVIVIDSVKKPSEN